MVLSDNFIKECDAWPAFAKAFYECPIAFFGATVFRKIKDGHKIIGKTAAYTEQARIIRTWFEKRPKVCVITGWQRTGKTGVGAYIGASWMLGGVRREWPGARCMGIKSSVLYQRRIAGERQMLIGGKNLDHIESVLLKQYRELLPSAMVKEWFSRQKHRVSLRDGTAGLVRSYDQDTESWKSGAYQLAHLDEEPPLDKLEEVLHRLATTKGPLIITVAIDDADVSYLPDACKNPMKYFGTDSFMHFKLGLEHVPHEIYPEEEKLAQYARFDNTNRRLACRKGEFSYMSGRWWSKFDVDTHVIKAFRVPREWKRWRFIDAGMAAPTACAWIAMHPKGDLFVYREFYKPGLTVDERCKAIIEMSGNTRQREDGIWVERHGPDGEEYVGTFLDHAEFVKDDVTGDDASWNYIQGGLVVQPWTTLGQQARREVVNQFLETDPNREHFITHKPGAPRLYIFDTCANLIWEANKKCEKRITNERSGVTERRVQNRDDHLLDATEAACVELRWMIDDKQNPA